MRAWLEEIVDSMKAILHWLAGKPAVLLGALGTLAGALAVLYSKKNQVGHLRDAIEVQKAKAEAARAQALADALEASAGAHDVRVQALRQQIADSQRHALELATEEDLTGLSNEEIAHRFSNSGL